jgi:hypothetical protein
MSKYMIQASYAAEGLQGLQKDKASGRRASRSGSVGRRAKRKPP